MDGVFLELQVVSFLLATAVGAGFAFSTEEKKAVHSKYNKDDFPREYLSGLDKYLSLGILATGMLSLGFICMALLSVLSSTSRTSPTNRG